MSDDLRIIPERDDPSSLASKGKPVKPDKKTPSRQPSNKSGSSPLVGVLCLVVVLVCGAAGYLYFQTVTLSQRNIELNDRLMAVEGKLSVTDESLSASGVAIQALLQEQKATLDEHKTNIDLALSEVDKLWGVAYRSNKPKIEALEKTLATQSSSVDKLQDTLSDLASLPDDLSTLTSRVDTTVNKSLALSAALDESQTSLRKQRDALTALESDSKAQSRLVSEHAEAIESFDQYRVQVNQRVLQLEGRSP